MHYLLQVGVAPDGPALLRLDEYSRLVRALYPNPGRLATKRVTFGKRSVAFLHEFGRTQDISIERLPVYVSEHRGIITVSADRDHDIFVASDKNFIRLSTLEYLANPGASKGESDEAIRSFLVYGHLSVYPGLLEGTFCLKRDARYEINIESSRRAEAPRPRYADRWPSRSSIATSVHRDTVRSPRRRALALSGGFDSRLLLHLIADQVDLAFSYGTQHERLLSTSDHGFARTLSKRHSIPFISVGPRVQINWNQAFERFACASESHIDHFGGYLDGLDSWRNLSSLGIKTVIRGDEAFGWIPVTSEQDALASVGLPAMTTPFKRNHPRMRPGRIRESMPAFRDRLYRDIRIPRVLEPLSKIKRHFISIINPFLAPDLIASFACLPDALRTNKRYVRMLYPEVSAKSLRTPSEVRPGARTYVAQLENHFRELLEDAHFFSPDLRRLADQLLGQQWKVEQDARRRSTALLHWTPSTLRAVARRVVGPRVADLPRDTLIFRMALLAEAGRRRRIAYEGQGPWTSPSLVDI